jgi:hypothetical protein
MLAGLQAVLRIRTIRDVYPESRIRIFSIPDPGSEIFPSLFPDPHLCRACLHSFFIDRQSTRELRITRIPRDAVI